MAQNISAPRQGSLQEVCYSYTPIDGPDIIRILTLNPGLPDGPLSGELHYVSLSDLADASNENEDEDRSFEAISTTFRVLIWLRFDERAGSLFGKNCKERLSKTAQVYRQLGQLVSSARPV
ncbi:hypothetical protein E8E12_007586 [Didymella heteroderae]|uniref:Uncharacterized protein n=1 Tax=Didymella heteroderae TaxID=1769908 RepID=A0A9P4WQF5_9PLEO|nr:hypothetical protein E8E12_007586 [Didymella heteroderae]